MPKVESYDGDTLIADTVRINSADIIKMIRSDAINITCSGFCK